MALHLWRVVPNFRGGATVECTQCFLTSRNTIGALNFTQYCAGTPVHWRAYAEDLGQGQFYACLDCSAIWDKNLSYCTACGGGCPPLMNHPPGFECAKCTALLTASTTSACGCFPGWGCPSCSAVGPPASVPCPKDPTNSFKELWDKACQPSKCSCPIKDLMTYGHHPGCSKL